MMTKNVGLRAALALAAALCTCACLAQEAAHGQPRLQLYRTEPEGSVSAFSTVGIAIHGGTLGAGFDVATPLGRRVNLRGTADFFRYNLGVTADGIDYGANLALHSGQVTLDYFPFWGFHISPGILIAKHDLSATLNVPAGGKFSLGDQDYYSSSTDPVHGSGALEFARTVSPELKIGFGNIIPRSGRHWSVPFEIGAAYIGHPTMTIAIAGTGCQNANDTNCANLATDPTAQQNVLQEQTDLNEKLKRASVFPIVTLGVSYKF